MNTQVSRPMLIALLATVAFAAVWFVALRPKSDSGGAKGAASSTASAPGVNGLTRAIGKAKGAVAQSQDNAGRVTQADAQAGGASQATTPTRSASPSQGSSATTTQAQAGAAPAAKAAGAKLSAGATAVNTGIERGKVVALLFFNPRSADDVAVRREFSHVSSRGGRVVVVTSPLAGLSSFGEVTKRVQVTETPAVIIFDRRARPSAIVGFTTHTEIDQRISDALAARR